MHTFTKLLVVLHLTFGVTTHAFSSDAKKDEGRFLRELLATTVDGAGLDEATTTSPVGNKFSHALEFGITSADNSGSKISNTSMEKSFLKHLLIVALMNETRLSKFETADEERILRSALKGAILEKSDPPKMTSDRIFFLRQLVKWTTSSDPRVKSVNVEPATSPLFEATRAFRAMIEATSTTTSERDRRYSQVLNDN